MNAQPLSVLIGWCEMVESAPLGFVSPRTERGQRQLIALLSPAVRSWREEERVVGCGPLPCKGVRDLLVEDSLSQSGRSAKCKGMQVEGT